MTDSLRIVTSLAAALLFLVLQAGAQLHTIDHAAQHAHHEATSHATTACSVMCAAGQVLHSIDEPVLVKRWPVTFLDQIAPTPISQRAPSFLSSRGPPESSLF